jgi:hydroxymethylglutaryl-CoA lyase
MLGLAQKQIKIVEVGPRDGLQNEKTIISLSDKVEYIKLLSAAGIKEIEANSFVRAEKIPQMGDGKELFHELSLVESLKKTKLISLIPNDVGLNNALEVSVKDIAVFTATSNSFNQKNINATIDESLDRISRVMEIANSHKMSTRGYISTVFGCPYEGKTDIKECIRIAHRLQSLGVKEISLGDTIGIAHPEQVKEILTDLKKEFDLSLFAMHFHDTRGMALANIYASLEMGMTIFDSSSGGLGGCPYAKGASGNVATEDVVTLLHSLGLQTGIDFDKLTKASVFILDKLQKKSASKSLTAYLANKI